MLKIIKIELGLTKWCSFFTHMVYNVNFATDVNAVA